MRRLGKLAGVGQEVDEFLRSPEWVDMLKVFDTQLITGTAVGLKMVAPLAGFAWPVEAAGGDEAMVRYDIAVAADEESERDQARAWLLGYNRADVEATLAVREWLPIVSVTGSRPSSHSVVDRPAREKARFRVGRRRRGRR